MKTPGSSTLAITALMAATLALPVAAQISPAATQQMGNAYRQQMMLNAIRQTNVNQTPRAGGQDGRRSATAVSKQRMMQLMHQLTPEYNERVRKYGRESANQWLAAKAREMGRMDAQSAGSGGH